MEENLINNNSKNEHFSEITISDYRIFKGLTFKNLSKVNLIVGENNTGKTSFLEAIGLLIGQNDVGNIIFIYSSRWKFFRRLQLNQNFYTQLKNELDGKTISLKGIFKNQESEVKINGYHEEGEGSFDINRKEYLFSLKLISSSKVEIKEGKSRVLLSTHDYFSKNESSRLCSFLFLNTYNINDENLKLFIYDKAIKEGLHEEIIEFIKLNIDSTIKDIVYLPTSQQFFVIPSKLDITSYGEGLQKIYFLAMMFASAKDGVVLIDELENGIHVDLLSRFIGFIFKLAEEFNVQVFLTTHSNECIRAFIDNTDDLSKISSYVLINNEDRIDVAYVSGEKISRLLNHHEFDLRRV
jgi:AAA15 family ATPase/GTPase